MQGLTDVWTLETPPEAAASEDLESIARLALLGNRKAQAYLKKLWPECSWPTIKERLSVEGSAWYVWWMDGVRQHVINDN